MQYYEEAIIELLREKGDYQYGILGWVSDQYTAGELMQMDSVRKAVIHHLGGQFVDQVIDEAIADKDYEFREDILRLVPPEVYDYYADVGID